MLDVATETLVFDTVENFTNHGSMFAVYDVTKSVRTQTSTRIEHPEVQDVVHNMFMDMEMPSNYTRTLHTFKTSTGQIVQAWVYHLIGQDVKLYNPDAVLQPHVAAVAQMGGTVSNVQQTGKSGTFTMTPNMQVAVRTAKQVNQPSTVPNNFNKVQVVHTDSRGRLCIPNALVKAAGFHVGDEVFVQSSSQQGLMVLTHVAWNHPQLGKTVVDKDSNIRVTPTMLRKNSYSGNTFKVRMGSRNTGNWDHITVEM